VTDAPALDADEPIVSVRDVAKSYRRGSETVRALVDASFELGRGEVVGLVGPSGSGKTTLLNVVAGWEAPDAGEIRWRGGPFGGPTMRWSDVAIVPQDLALLEELPNGENAGLPLRLASGGVDADDPARLGTALGIDGLADRLPAEVSLGEQQRVAIARALALRPALLLADEPTAHQDEASTKLVLAAVRSAASAGTACLIATHSAEVIDALDRVLSIRDGRIAPAAGSA